MFLDNEYVTDFGFNKQTVTMKNYDKGYVLFNWLHYNFNLPNAYKDIANRKQQKL